MAYYQQRRAGDTLTLLSTDAAIISGFVTDTLVQLLPALLTFGGAFVMMAWLDWSIAVVAVVFLPAYFVTMKVGGAAVATLSPAWVDANSQLVSVVEENLGMLPAIKAFTREAHEQGRLMRPTSACIPVSRRQWRIQAALSPPISLLGAWGVDPALAGHQPYPGQPTGALRPGHRAALRHAADEPLSTLANVRSGAAHPGQRRAPRRVPGEQPEPADDGDLVLDNVKGHIEFRDVNFWLPGAAAGAHGLQPGDYRRRDPGHHRPQRRR